MKRKVCKWVTCCALSTALFAGCLLQLQAASAAGGTETVSENATLSGNTAGSEEEMELQENMSAEEAFMDTERAYEEIPEAFQKLAQLLGQDQFELLFPDKDVENQDEMRLVYLMNDAVESFLVFSGARMTGHYQKDYEGELDATLSQEDGEYVLVVYQGETVVTIFFQDLLLEMNLYNYGDVGHFWVKGYENLRVMEYQIAILRDKYEYLGEKYCTEYEGKLAMLRDFPPLNYLFYPAVPEKYIVPVDNPWEVTAEALAVMQELATEAGDEKLGKMLRRYEKNPDISNAKKIAGMLCRSSHLPVITLLGEKIREAASVYPDRDFGRKQNKYLHELMEKAERRKEELEAENVQTLIYREEPFIYDCDSISFQVYLMIVRKGVWKQKIMVEKI